MSRRTERLERARKQRQQRNLLVLGGGGLALVLIAVVIALAGGPAVGPQVTAESLSRVSVQEAYRMVQAGEATLLDVRSADAYQALHAEGAVSLPEGQAVQLLPTLPADGQLIFY